MNNGISAGPAQHSDGLVTRRGRVLRDTSMGDGLVFVDDTQYPFRLEMVWRSEFAPKVDMPVEVDFDAQRRIVPMRAASLSARASKLARDAAERNRDMQAFVLGHTARSAGTAVLQRTPYLARPSRAIHRNAAIDRSLAASAYLAHAGWRRPRAVPSSAGDD